MTAGAASYGDVVAANIRAARARIRLSQQGLTDRMRALGFDAWFYQTVGNIERGHRRVTAEEIHGLSWALETTIPVLTGPGPDEDGVVLPSGDVIGAESVRLLCGRGRNDGAVTWKDDGTVVIQHGT